MIEAEAIDVASLYSTTALIHLFLDNARYHHAKIVRKWLSQPGRRIALLFVPSYCPHLKPIERLWALMHQHLTHNKTYPTCREFADAILNFLRDEVSRKWGEFCDSVTDNFRLVPEPHLFISPDATTVGGGLSGRMADDIAITEARRRAVVRNRVLFGAAVAGLAVSLAGCEPVGYGYVAPVYADGYYGGYAVPVYAGEYYGGYVVPVYASGYYSGGYYGGFSWRHGYYGDAYRQGVHYHGHGGYYHGDYRRGVTYGSHWHL